jgi:hypothetical protein
MIDDDDDDDNDDNNDIDNQSPVPCLVPGPPYRLHASQVNMHRDEKKPIVGKKRSRTLNSPSVH